MSQKLKGASVLVVMFVVMTVGFQNCGSDFAVMKIEDMPSLPGPTGSNAMFKCMAGDDPAPAPLQRLTKNELNATYTTVLAASSPASMLATQMKAVPPEVESEGFDVLSNTVSNEHVLAYFMISYAAASHVLDNEARRMALIGACAKTNDLMNVACATNFLEKWGRRTLRRPLTAEEKTNYLAVFNETGSTRRFAGMHAMMMAVFNSPSFLYKLEVNGALENDRADLAKLDGFEMASRLSYLYWGTSPDDALLDAAAAGELDTQEGIKKQAERLIADTKAQGQFRNFYSEWLGLQKVPTVSGNEIFIEGVIATGLSNANKLTALEALKTNAVRETNSFIDYHAWRNNSTFTELMTSDLVFPATADLAKIFDTAVNSTGPEKSKDPSRRGLLARPAVLMHDTLQSRPILRGVFAQKQLLCDPIPMPAVEIIDDARTAPIDLDPLAGTRVEVNVRTSGPNCAVCHDKINPIGFALEGFDSFGRSRPTERIFDDAGNLLGTASINTTGSLPVGNRSLAIRDSADLAEAVAVDERGAACFARKYFRATTGRFETEQDGCQLSSMTSKLADPNKPIKEVLLDISLHPHFRLKKLK